MPPLTTYRSRRPLSRPQPRKRNPLPALVALLAVMVAVGLATAYAMRPSKPVEVSRRVYRAEASKPDPKDPFPKHAAFSADATASAEETVAPVDPLKDLRSKDSTVVASAAPSVVPAVVVRPTPSRPVANPATWTPEPTTPPVPPVVKPPVVTPPPVIAWWPWMNGRGLKLGHWK